MAEADKAPTSTVKVPGLKPIPVVVVRTPDGRILVRHPDELEKQPGVGPTQ